MPSQLTPDAQAPPVGESGLASWYVPGRTDGFGDRLLMFDNVGTPSLELLRFRSDLSRNQAFEHHLRERVQQLLQFRHPAFSPAHRVQRLANGEGLALVSTHAEGLPLSGVIARLNGEPAEPQSVAALVDELLQGLQALHAEGAAHGAITPDRLVVQPGGGLRITEHVLGAALQQLPLLPSQLWREFNVVSPPDRSGFADVSPQSDLVQAAAVALSLLLARPVTQLEIEQRLPALMDEASRPSSRTGRASGRLKRWFEQAFRTRGHGFETAADAGRDLRDLANGRTQLSVDAPSAGERVHGTAAVGTQRTYPSVSELAPLTDYPSEQPASPASAPVTASGPFTFEFVAAQPVGDRHVPSSAAPHRRAPRVVRLEVALTLGALAVIEAVVIIALAARALAS